MRRDVHQGRSTRLPSRPVRSAHDDEHPGVAAGEQLLEALRAGAVRCLRHAHQGRDRAVLHQRPAARRVQVAQGQDGCVQPEREDAAGVPGRHRGLADRPLRDRRHAAHPQGKHRADPQAGRQVHARAEGPESRRQPAGRSGVRQPGGLRAGDDRRLQGGRHFAAESVGAVLQQGRCPVLDQE